MARRDDLIAAAESHRHAAHRRAVLRTTNGQGRPRSTGVGDARREDYQR